MARPWKFLLLGLLLASLIPFGGRKFLERRETNPLLRGENIARDNGCLVCHLPWGGQELPNPGSRWGTVPRFQAGNAMMYAANLEEIEEFIRFGAPRSWLENPKTRQRLENQRLRMPAYDGRFPPRDLRDLVAYVAAEEGLGGPMEDPAVDAGRSVARRQGCLSCHGVEGAGGRPNPGSLGGFVPGFLGKNFTDLVRDEEEFRQWVRTGRLERLEANRIASFFLRRQQLAMPAYGDALSDEELHQLWLWVQASRTFYDSHWAFENTEGGQNDNQENS